MNLRAFVMNIHLEVSPACVLVSCSFFCVVVVITERQLWQNMSRLKLRKSSWVGSSFVGLGRHRVSVGNVYGVHMN